jgi:potassium-transporting ATPase KdpC subunit
MNQTLTSNTLSSVVQMLRPAFTLFIVLSLVTGLAYPLLVTGIAQSVFPDQANGSLIKRDGQPVGSRLIGQSFTDPKYFWGRPSATSPMSHNASASGGSNLGTLNPSLVEAVQPRIEALRTADPGNTASVPVDLVTASGSGLDPYISRAAADYQAGRIARTRNIPEAQVRTLIERHTVGVWLGFLGEPRVNVLELNLDLDSASH